MKKIFSLFLSLVFVTFLTQAQNAVEQQISTHKVESQQIAPTINSTDNVQNINTEKPSNDQIQEINTAPSSVDSKLSTDKKMNCNPSNCKKTSQCKGKKHCIKDDAAGQTLNNDSNSDEKRVLSPVKSVDSNLQLAAPMEQTEPKK